MEFIKKHWAYILVVIIVLIFIIQMVLYYSTFKNYEFGWNVFTGLTDKNWDLKDKEGNIIDDGLEGKWGAFGDFIGGILNPILGFITVILLLIAHGKDSKRDINYHEQRQTDLLLERLNSLKDLHINNTQNIRVIKKESDSKSQLNQSFNENYFEDYIIVGSMFFSILDNVIKKIFNKLIKQDVEIKELDALKIVYLLIYFGKQRYFKDISDQYEYSKYNCLIRKVLDELEVDLEKKFGLVLFTGFRTQLSSYYRVLYHIMGVIENQKIIDEKHKYELAKDFRVQMSPQEQKILLINSLVTQGKKWNDKGYLIIFKLFRNIDFNNEFGSLNIRDIVGNKIDEYAYLDLNKLKKYYFKDDDLDNFKKNYFEFF